MSIPVPLQALQEIMGALRIPLDHQVVDLRLSVSVDQCSRVTIERLVTVDEFGALNRVLEKYELVKREDKKDQPGEQDAS